MERAPLPTFLLCIPMGFSSFQAAIRKELNEFKSTEMEVHELSRHLTRLVSRVWVVFFFLSLQIVMFTSKLNDPICFGIPSSVGGWLQYGRR